MTSIKHVITCTIILSLLAFSASAQSGRMKRANKKMEEYSYIEAIELYNQILEKEDNSEAKVNIATAYRKIGDAENAEYWYSQVVRLPEAESVHYLFYGQMLQRNGKCALAKEWYTKYIEEVPDDMRGQYLVRACDYEEELMIKNAGIYQIKQTPFNTNGDDFGPTYYKDGVIFASERDKGGAIKREHTWTGMPFLELYYVKAEEQKSKDDDSGLCGDFQYSEPTKFSKKINSKYHDANATFSSDQSEIFFTRNLTISGKTGRSEEGAICLKIFSAKSDGGDGWTEMEGMPFNSDEYSVAHPTLTTDGTRMYFSSDMPGGFGGMDIYYTDRENGRWGPPMNLGPGINTEGNEIFPYYHSNNILYFSSDGHIGLGGLDIYSMEDKGDDTFGEVTNIGYPINTISDDFSITLNEDGTCGYFSSDREGGAGRDDIYSFKKMASPIEVLVVDAKTEEPIQGASVINDCTGETMTTSADGKVLLEMKMNICCKFEASAETYMSNSEEGCTKDIPVGEKVFVTIPLSQESKFDLEGIVFDDITNLPLEGATIILKSDCEGEEDQVITTDETGSYYFELGDDCCYTLVGEKEDYLRDVIENQCTRGLDTSTTLLVNLNLAPINTDGEEQIVDTPEDMVSKNGKDGVTTNEPPDFGFTPAPGPISFLVHIYYDFDRATIRPEAEPELEKLLSVINNNPEYVIEIGSHTDSRGSFAYNKRLSQRRANSVVRWLVDHGVSKEQLKAVGYGEKINVNNCKNYVRCSEDKHQLNRRTEFKVVGKVGEEMQEIQVSQAKSKPRLDPCEGCPF